MPERNVRRSAIVPFFGSAASGIIAGGAIVVYAK